jgi:FG-GAP-like repeat
MRPQFRAAAVVSLLLFSLSALCQFPNPKVYHNELLSPILEADINHDGKPDVVALEARTAPTVAVFLGDGKGGLKAPKTTPITGVNNAQGFAVGDFNGDGNPDVAIGGSDPVTGSWMAAVMLGNGDGTFQSAQEVGSIATVPGPILTGDFNGDGKIDIVISVNSGLTVLLGKGDGTFSNPIITNSGFNARCMAAGDFNGDGKLDLTMGTAVMLGNGDGTFQAPLSVTKGGCAVAVADVNHDGNLDLITGGLEKVGSEIQVHLGDGTGKFKNATSYKTGWDAGGGIAVGDFNGDGEPDLAVTNLNNGDITVLLNQGKGQFTIGKTFTFGGRAALVGDFNGDHKLDLVVDIVTGTDISKGLAVLIGNGDGTFQDSLAQNFQLPDIQLKAVDINKDGKFDLIDYGSLDPVGAVQLSQGDGTFGAPIPFPSVCLGNSGVRSVAVGDFNHDGKLDIATLTGTPGVNVCLGNGDGTFQPGVVYDQNINHNSVATGDFNHDGRLDLAVSDQGGIGILLGNGDGTFQPEIPTGLNAQFPVFVLGDFNHDGKLDVAAITNNATITVLPGLGNGKFGNPMVSPAPQDPLLLAMGDLNNDGKLDIVTDGNGTISVQLGNGDGTFKAPVSYSTFNSQWFIVRDINGDGILDVALASSASQLTVFFGKGDGTLNAAKLFNIGNDNFGIAAGDFTGNGDLDIATSSRYDKLTVLLNQGKKARAGRKNIF